MLPIYSSDIYTMIRAGIVCNIMFHSRFYAAIICYIHFRDLHSMDLTHSIISIQTKWYTILINPMRTCQSNVNDIASKANKISSNLYTTSMAECSSRTKHVFVSLGFFFAFIKCSFQSSLNGSYQRVDKLLLIFSSLCRRDILWNWHNWLGEAYCFDRPLRLSLVKGLRASRFKVIETHFTSSHFF